MPDKICRGFKAVFINPDTIDKGGEQGVTAARYRRESSVSAHLKSFECGFGFTNVGFNDKVKTEVEIGFDLGIVIPHVPPKCIRPSSIIHIGERL
ncbi:hypothetical protein D3C87_1976650 [compost metagenome]